MECPECHGFSVVVKDGQKTCSAKGCTFMEFHVITYENENRQFEGEKGTENRFTNLYANGMVFDKETRLDKNFDTSSKIIKGLVKQMGLSSDLIDRAQSKLSQILKLKQKGKENSGEEKNKDRITTPNRDIAGYCLWAACYDCGMFWKDVRIANELEITKSGWEAMVKQLEKGLIGVMDVPKLGLDHSILRVCRKHNIEKIQTDAMLKMVERIRDEQIEGGTRNSTKAAAIFWLVMINSSKYNGHGQFDIKKYLMKKEKKDESQGEYWTQTHFDCSYEAMKKFKSEHQAILLASIPDFATKLPETKGKN